jgi:hypothetical protein
MNYGDWIFEDNLQPWLEILSQIVGYGFDTLDLDAIRVGIADSDSEPDRWYCYPLGNSGASVRLRREPGSAVISFDLDGFEEDQRAEVLLSVSIAQNYRVVLRR